MKIGFVLNDYFPFGGLQSDCLATALATQQLGHEVHVCARTWQGDRPTGLHIHLLGKRGWSNLSRNDHFFRALEGALPAYDLDGVVAFSRIPHADIYFAADPCFLEKKKRLAKWQKLLPRYRYYAKLEATVFDGAQAPETLVLTEREIEAFHTHYGVPRERFHLLPPGVQRREGSPADAMSARATLRQELGTLEDSVVALFVGSGFRVKGLDRALLALRANQNSAKQMEFWVVGDDNSARFRSLAEQAGVPVRFLGGRADVKRFYDAADFLLHPAYSESAGKVLLEALTHGLPVLTTDTCGYAPHIEAADAGFVVPSPFAQDGLNDALRRFIEDDAARERWSHNALRYAGSEDLYSCHQAAAKLIGELLSL